MIIKTITLRCDVCPAKFVGGDLETQTMRLRRLARIAGWVHRDGKDLCSRCAVETIRPKGVTDDTTGMVVVPEGDRTGDPEDVPGEPAGVPVGEAAG